jgi:isochorismate synthase EntC
MMGGERDDYGRKRKDNDFLMTEQVRIDDLLNGKVANGDLPSTSEVANKCFISRALTPNYILYPHFFASASRDAEDDKEEEDNRALSFPFALQKMIQSLKSLLEENTLCNDQLLRLKLGIMDHEEFPLSEKASSSSSSSSGTSPRRYTIQIQQKISHNVDALCWIHANQPKIDACTNTVYTGISGLGATTYTTTSSSSQPCMMYMCNAENTFEGAAIGEAWRVDDLSKDDCWDMIRSLPCGSGLYGGRRFDTEGDVGEEWEEFGKELWVLPLVELRLEKKYNNRGTSTMGVDCDVVESIQEMEVKRDIEDMKLMVHLHFSSKESLIREVKRVLELLDVVTPDVSASVPCATLPPILSRGYNPDAQDIFEGGVNAALECFQRSSLASLDDGTGMKKVVLARRADLYFGTQLKGLDVLKTLKFGGSVGHLFYMNPGRGVGKEFFGCTPERLFQVKGDEKLVISEALAGTRPRGTTSEDDAELLRELIHSKKDKEENIITGDYIQNIFDVLVQQNMLEMNASVNGGEDSQGKFFVRRLRQLQHICQSFEGRIKNESRVVDIIRYLMEMLHPTPAVCGYPRKHSIDFIRRYEGRSFDRGLYSGPFGFLGSNTADIIVAIRSALITRNIDYSSEVENFLQSKVSVYAGAGIVQGSTAQGEWSETGYKLGVLSSLFAQSPLTLKSFQTPNEAWATAFVEELIRSGVTQFYICPGSRSTPLTTALARAQRTHVGIIDCISTHDERGAAFRALGYARGARRPAAVVTSSGTAVANLYPAVVEAGMDGIPILLLTADRPYENRDTGANQAIDQIKVRPKISDIVYLYCSNIFCNDRLTNILAMQPFHFG